MPQTTSNVSLWESVNQELKNLFPNDLYDMWFEGLTCAEESDSKLVLTAPNEFNAIWIENNYLDIIAQQARSFAGTAVAVSIEVAEEADVATDTTTESPANTTANRLKGLDSRGARSVDAVTNRGVSDPQVRRTFLNPRNTFQNLVVGSGNQLSHAASMAVANAPGRAYNPLFVYGETGLGTTSSWMGGSTSPAGAPLLAKMNRFTLSCRAASSVFRTPITFEVQSCIGSSTD